MNRRRSPRSSGTAWAPKMGHIVDYQVLHDAFFKWQTKPPLSVLVLTQCCYHVAAMASRRWRAGMTTATPSPRRRPGVVVRESAPVSRTASVPHRRGPPRGQGI